MSRLAFAVFFLMSFTCWAGESLPGNADIVAAELVSTPPMGWNSWDCYGASVTEAEVLQNATFMAENLASVGWQYIVVDIRWTVQNPATQPYNQRDPRFTLDKQGRFTPAENRFPSARDGKGFAPLAEQVHSLGLKFGIHIMRGIPKVAVDPQLGAPASGYPIEGSKYTTHDISIIDNGAIWLRDMFGMQRSEAAQAYYDSLLRLYASWGVDYLKVDDLNNPYAKEGELDYYADEIEMIRKAIDRCGRSIVLSTSPGPHPLAHGEHISQNANLWRVSNDFWDDWNALTPQFKRLHDWTPYRKPGRWPDGDMLPLGRLAIRGERGEERASRFTPDEQVTLMSIWSIANSPLMFGGDLPSCDDWTLKLITNPEVLAVNQQGSNAHQVARNGSRIIWMADAPGEVARNGKYVAVFNLDDKQGDAFDKDIALSLFDCHGPVHVRDLWRGEGIGEFHETISVETPPHGARLLLLTSEK